MISLSSVSYAVCWRWTSHLEDETICLAGMLRRDVSKLLELKDSEERMVAFLTGFEKLPAVIVFSAITRLQSPCYRWVPKSFMGIGTSAVVQWRRKSAVCTPAGLQVVFPGLWLHERPKIRMTKHGDESFLVASEGGEIINCVAPGEAKTIACDSGGFTPDQLAIILQDSLNEDGTPKSRSAALVTVDDADGGCL